MSLRDINCYIWHIKGSIGLIFLYRNDTKLKTLQQKKNIGPASRIGQLGKRKHVALFLAV